MNPGKETANKKLLVGVRLEMRPDALPMPIRIEY